jgi:hypothetical protein
VSEHERQFGIGELAVGNVEVGSTHAARVYADHDLTGGRARNGDVDEAKGFAGAMQDLRAHA